MAEKMVEEKDRPWQVRQESPDTFHSGHMDQDKAQARCDKANEDAKALGIKATYKVVEK